MKVLRILLVICLIVASASFPLHAAEDYEIYENKQLGRSNGQAFVPGEVVVKYVGDTVRYNIMKVGKGNEEARVKALRKNPNVQFADVNYYAYATSEEVPDPYFSYQWHLQGRYIGNKKNGGMNAEEAWTISKGDGIIVAVIDTGIDAGAPDFGSTSFVSGYDFVNDDNDPTDDNGHGTHVAGTIAQSTMNGVGVAGVAYKASLMPIKVLNRKGSGSYTDIIDGIDEAVIRGAHVINLSLGGSADYPLLKDAVDDAVGAGVVVVAAAGNDNGGIIYPAKYDSVIAVGATRIDMKRSGYSNYGPELDLVAPGGDTSVDQNDDGYGDGVLQSTFGGRPVRYGYFFFQGTSMASPHVAGTAALMLSYDPGMTPLEVKDVLQSTAHDLGASGWDQYYGHGLIDAHAALLALDSQPDPNNQPQATLTSVDVNEEEETDITVTGSDLDVGDTLTYAITAYPEHGSYTWDAPVLTYTSNVDYNDLDYFTYTVTDSKGASDSSTVTINVLAVNDAPEAGPASGVTTVGTAVDITLNGSDVDNDDADLIYSIYGTLEDNAIVEWTGPKTLDYTPGTTVGGTETFQYRVFDGVLYSEPGTVTITVNEPAQVTYSPVMISTEAIPARKKFNVEVTAITTVSQNILPDTEVEVTGQWIVKGEPSDIVTITTVDDVATFTLVYGPVPSAQLNKLSFDFEVLSVKIGDITYSGDQISEE